MALMKKLLTKRQIENLARTLLELNEDHVADVFADIYDGDGVIDYADGMASDDDDLVDAMVVFLGNLEVYESI